MLEPQARAEVCNGGHVHNTRVTEPSKGSKHSSGVRVCQELDADLSRDHVRVLLILKLPLFPCEMLSVFSGFHSKGASNIGASVVRMNPIFHVSQFRQANSDIQLIEQFSFSPLLLSIAVILFSYNNVAFVDFFI